MSFLLERGCPGSAQAECRGREQLTRLRLGQPPLPRAAGAGRPARLEPVTRRSPFPRSPPFISPRLAPARSPGPSTAPSPVPPRPPPSCRDPATGPGVADGRSARTPSRFSPPDLRCACAAAPRGAGARANVERGGSARTTRCCKGDAPVLRSYLRDLAAQLALLGFRVFICKIGKIISAMCWKKQMRPWKTDSDTKAEVMLCGD